MMTRFRNLSLPMAILCLVFLTTCQKVDEVVAPLPSTATIAGITYSKMDNVWYLVDADGNWRVDFSNLEVQPKDGVDMLHFNFLQIGVAPVSVSGPFVEVFYFLDLSKSNDPFTVARRLWNTGKFVNMVFGTFGIPLGNSK